MKFYREILIVLLITFSFFSSCQPAAEVKEAHNTISKPQKQPLPDTTHFPLPHNTEQVAGFYQGTFPCTDCEGMEQLLLLKKNGTYKQAFTNVDSNKVKSQSSGSWTMKGNQVTLMENNQNKLIFQYANDDLMAISIDRIMINDPSKYLLSKKSFAGYFNAWENERNKGTLFVAHGNEPFWNLNIKSGLVSFKASDWKNELIARNVQIEKINNSTIYNLKSNGKEWKITVIDRFCNDGMSDIIYEYHVVVHYEGKDYFGCGVDFKDQ